MTFRLFATYEAMTSSSARLAAWFEGKPSQLIRSVEGIERADMFVPDREEVVFFDDGLAPAVQLQICAPDIAQLEQLVANEEFKSLFLDEPLNLAPETELSFGIFETASFPVHDDGEVLPRTAPMSFVVRYYGPMKDEKAFQEFYVANHLPALSKLPGIRNVYAFLPVDWRNPGLPASNVRLGNEVVFDDVAALLQSFKSDAIIAVRNDSRQFPPFGHSTHHTMQRRTLL